MDRLSTGLGEENPMIKTGQKLLEIRCEKTYPSVSPGGNTFKLSADFTVQRGEFFSLVGPSGCGKTTLLRLIAGLEKPEKGQIVLAGKEITGLPPAKRRIGMVFQDYALFPHLNVEQNIAYGLKLQKLPRKDIKSRVEELLELFALKGLEERDVYRLSGGERQRVALARALAPRPLVLLLDEPFSALDYELRRRLRGELKELQSRLGFTALFVTHHQEEALSLSHRLAVMEAGEIIQIGKAQEVYDHPQNPFVAEFLGEANLIPCILRSFHPEDLCRMEIQGGDVLEIRLSGETGPTNWNEGESFYLLIRPEDLLININSSSDKILEFEGEIKKVEYYGYNRRLEVESKGHRLSVLVDKEIAGIDEGKKISLGLDLTRLQLIPRS